MKKLLTLLTTLLLLFAFSPRVMASKNVYLLTGNTVNGGGVKGNWGKVAGVTPNSDLKLNQVGSTEEYCITLTSTDQPLIYFAFQVDGNPIKILKPNGVADVELTINNGAKENTQEDGGKAWKVNFTNAYSQIVIHVDLNEKKLWVTGTAADIAPSYYLIGKLLNDQWSDDNNKGYKLTTTDNKIYSYTVDNNKADNYEFRFRIGTNDNTKATAYHPKDGTVETIGDHKNGYKLDLKTEAGMEQSESHNYWYATLEARHSYTFTFDAEKKTIIYKDKGDDGLGKAKNYELVFSYGTTEKVLPFSESRLRKERNAAMPYSTDLSTVGFKDEWLPGKAGDKIRIYARKTTDHSYTLNPAVDGSTFGAELQPTDAKFSSIKSYKTEEFVTGHPENAYIITKGSGVSYTVALNLGGEIKTTTKTTSGANNNISHYVKGKSLSLYVNKSMSEVYSDHSSSYKKDNEEFYLIGALTGGAYKKEKADAKKMERKVYINPITNKTDSVVYTSVIRWEGTTASNLWFAFAPEYLYNDNSLTWTSSDPYSPKSRWNYIARAQVQDEYDATAQYGCMNLSGTKGDVLCNGEQALNPKVKEEYSYYMVRFNVTTSTYRLIFYKENPVIIKRSKNKFIRTYCSNASWDLPTNGKVKAYVVHSYADGENGGMESQGVMKLREIKYIPAEMGVVLVADGTGETADKIEVNLVSKWDGFATTQEDLWVKKEDYTGQSFNNYLVGLSTDGMFVTEGDFDEEHHYYVNRNFGLNWFSNTKTGKALKETGTSGLEDKTNGDAGDNDYLGFFRLKGNVQKEYAYLQLSKEVVNYDLQLTGSKKENNKAIQEADAKLSPNFGMYFDTDFDFVTGINSVSEVKKNSNNGCYTLQGVKVQRPTAPGLYIMNGKKVIVK